MCCHCTWVQRKLLCQRIGKENFAYCGTFKMFLPAFSLTADHHLDLWTMKLNGEQGFFPPFVLLNSYHNPFHLYIRLEVKATGSQWVFLCVFDECWRSVFTLDRSFGVEVEASFFLKYKFKSNIGLGFPPQYFFFHPCLFARPSFLKETLRTLASLWGTEFPLFKFVGFDCFSVCFFLIFLSRSCRFWWSSCCCSNPEWLMADWIRDLESCKNSRCCF